MTNFPDIDPDDLSNDKLSPGEQELLNEYNRRNENLFKRVWSLVKAKESVEKDHLNGILDYLQKVKNYSKRSALQIVVKIGKSLKYSQKVVNEFFQQLGGYFFDDF